MSRAMISKGQRTGSTDENFRGTIQRVCNGGGEKNRRQLLK